MTHRLKIKTVPGKDGFSYSLSGREDLRQSLDGEPPDHDERYIKTRLKNKTVPGKDGFSYSLSGREDLNLRPLAPHASALAGLRHAPR